MSRSNKVIVPSSKAALNQLKYEIAAEFGLLSGGYTGAGSDTEFAGELGSVSSGGSGGQTVQWSTLSTRQAGSVGGEITRRLISQAEQVIGGGFTL
ncbi:alpha/beta-type small acid-soluble spore protein [Paenibacillus sp. GSMTC-2017]|uniref:alpha/beta-type small acid-soluble spore protein n=1 Tax=Paenibacillus sp. GSMTC-2017 TaxID=2794350 RepID=UPI0018D9EDA2|nr:alpha/beta-type small acid-soluble spore protein [Paenibacillus sp. GSMTC-2017]MBH5320605.1 alpha/beta-type small acid-soluble spore protein [Paenibacillus sp. GSMTC-2017]